MNKELGGLQYTEIASPNGNIVGIVSFNNKVLANYSGATREDALHESFHELFLKLTDLKIQALREIKNK